MDVTAYNEKIESLLIDTHVYEKWRNVETIRRHTTSRILSK